MPKITLLIYSIFVSYLFYKYLKPFTFKAVDLRYVLLSSLLMCSPVFPLGCLMNKSFLCWKSQHLSIFVLLCIRQTNLVR